MSSIGSTAVRRAVHELTFPLGPYVVVSTSSSFSPARRLISVRNEMSFCPPQTRVMLARSRSARSPASPQTLRADATDCKMTAVVMPRPP